MSREQDICRQIEDAVERGATEIEEIHRVIADLPFEVLERNGLSGELSSELRGIQIRTLGAIYDAVRSVNHRVGELASDLLDGSVPTRADDGSPG